MSLEKNPIAGGIDAAVSQAIPPTAEELHQRNTVKAELYRLIEVVEAGRFCSMITTEEAPNTFPTQLKTAMWGDTETLRASAAQVVMVYADRDKKAEAARRDEAGIIEVPSKSGLILPGVQS